MAPLERDIMNSSAASRWSSIQVSFSFLLLVLLGCNNQAAKPPEKSPPAPVTAEKAEEESLTQTTPLFGTIQPVVTNAAKITANVSAPVLSILKGADGRTLVEGQRVKEGDVVVRLDDRILKEQRTQADVAVKTAKRKVEQQERIKKETPKAFSQFDLDNAIFAQEDAVSKLKGIDEQLKLYTLKAPIAGRLGRILVQQGQAVSPGTVIADVINLEDQVDALCFAPPHLARRLQLHQHAFLGTHENEGPEGEVVFIAQQAEADTGQFAVKVRFPNHAQFFWQRESRANTTVHVQVLTQFRLKTWVIPLTALLEDQDPPTVVVVRDLKTEKNEEGKEEKVGKAQLLSAEVGLRDQEHVEILSLKTRGEKKEPVAIQEVWFVTKGAQGLHDDDPVKIEEEEEGKEKEKEHEKQNDQKKEKEKE
jgi:multidrug efflux system membrane fusion protein